MRWMLILLIAGLAFAGTGMYPLLFTDLVQTRGVGGIITIVTLLTIGAFMAVPAKIHIILRFTRGPQRQE